MKLFKDYIRKNSEVLPGNNLKVDSFLNQQLDVKLLKKLASELKKLYAHDGITKILTIESSGIALATMCGYVFGCPVVVAKKSQTKNINGSIYIAKVDTYQNDRVYDICVAKQFLSPDDRILIVDDILANGNAINGLIDIVETAQATVGGVGIAIEKTFTDGSKKVRSRNVKVEALVKIKALNNQTIEFEDN